MTKIIDYIVERKADYGFTFFYFIDEEGKGTTRAETWFVLSTV